MLTPSVRLLVIPPLAAFLAANVLFAAAALVRPTFVLVRVIYDANTLYFPALFALCGLGLLAMKGGRRHPRVVALVLVLAAGCFGARVYATHMEPRRLVIHRVTLPVPGLAGPVRLLHISDIQSDSVGTWEERVFREIADLDPDLIIHTGDFLHPIPPATVPSELPRLQALMDRLDPPLGKLTVDGDTDYWVRPGTAEVAGMRRLAEEPVILDAAGARIRILGLTLWQSAAPGLARAVVDAFARSAAPGDVTIVAGHRPDFAMALEDLPVDLVLAGHTHGGQIRVPFYGPLVTLSRVPKEWARGFRRIGKPWLNVSAGLGAEHTAGLPAIRINCPPEMTLITLQPE